MKNSEYQVVGKSVLRTDAAAKVTGDALYAGDLSMPGMLHMTTLFAGRPHARILRIETTAADGAEGVVAVFTARDVPVNEHGIQLDDQPVLCGPGSAKEGADVVRFVGDQVALVVAETEAQARAAMNLIEIEWQDLPLLLDPEEAAPSIAGGLREVPSDLQVPFQIHPHCGDNLTYSYRVRKGDAEAAMRTADVVVEGVYRTPVQEHAYLQPEAGVSYIDEEGRITVVVAGQWTHCDKGQIAHSLDIPDEQVRVIYPAIGGAFGGREDMSVQITLGLAALRLAQRGIVRPIKTVWTRQESIVGHCKRHAMKIYARWGARRDGMLVAAQVKVVADGGAYRFTSNKVLGNTTLTCTGPYEIPNAAVDTYAVYTNNVPGGAFRGFGGPQGCFAAESQMDRLAEALGMDPVELRLKNVLTGESLLTVGTPVPGGIGMTEVIKTAARSAGWTEDEAGHWHRPSRPEAEGPILRGIGLAAGFKNVGFSFGYQENCWARIELRGASQVEQAEVHIAAADCGQGNHTVVAQMAAEALGVAYERVRVVASDTATMGNAGSASASRLTYMTGNAVRSAAEKALAAWEAEDRPAIGEETYLAPKTSPLDHQTGYGMPNFAYGYVAEAAQVAVNTETGEVHVERFVCADDVGQAINPQLVAGQIEGGAVQALGYALMEDFKTGGGQVLTDRFSTYLIPTILDIPDRLDSLIVEVPDPNGPFGARGMGEMPYLPAAAATVFAVHDATGVRFSEFPLTAERVWRGLQAPSAT